VTVVSSFPLGETVQNREASGRVAKWTIELMGETLSFAPKKAIKSHILVDFLDECTDTQLPTDPIQAELWTMYFDGSLMKMGAYASLLFISPLGVHMCYIIRLHFAASNNVAKYEALVNGLRITIELGVRRLDVRGDSQLVNDQVMKNSSYHDARMEANCEEVRRLEDKFFGLELSHIARRYNEVVDELAKIASGRTTVPPNVFSRDVYKPSDVIKEAPKPDPDMPQSVIPKPCKSMENRAGLHGLQTGEPCTWSTSSEEKSLLSRLRPDAWLGGRKPSYCSEEKRSCTDVAPPECSSGAYPSARDMNC
jgi:ribonuclease HI